MKYIVASILAATTLATAGAANAQNEGFYLGGFGGVSFFDEVSLESPIPTMTGATDTGFGFGGAMGYGLDNGLRFEGEVAYRQADIGEMTIGGVPIPADFTTDSLSVMANVWYDLPVDLGRFQPYVGGGIGLADTELTQNGPSVVTFADRVFAYQLGAGTSVDLGDGLEAFVQYRYFGADDPSAGFLGGDFDWNLASHNVEGGLRLWLN